MAYTVPAKGVAGHAVGRHFLGQRLLGEGTADSQAVEQHVLGAALVTGELAI